MRRLHVRRQRSERRPIVDRVDGDVGDRTVAGTGAGGADRVDHRPALGVGDLAEDGVLEVQVRGLGGGDEELAAVGVRSGVGHREQVRPVEAQLGVELVGEVVARAAGAAAQRVAALDHEVVDHPVEDGAVVERPVVFCPGARVGPLLGAGGQLDEVGDRLGGVVAEQVDLDVAGRGVQGGRLGCRHVVALLS